MTARFTYFAPGAALAGLVAFHYVLETGAEGLDAGLCALLAQVQIVLGSIDYRFGRRPAGLAQGATLIGATDSAGWLTAAPGVTAIGCGLTPAGWQALTGGWALANAMLPLPDADRLAAACARADDAAGMAATLDAAGMAATLDAAGMAATLDAAGMAATLDAWLTARLAGAVPDPRVAIIDAWIIAGDGWDIDALSARLGLSRRSVERLTLATHGATPKRLAAKYRTLQAAGRTAVGEVTDWRDAVAIGGFVDQPHFIREFKRFVGVTPQRFLRQPDSFAATLLRGNWQPGKALGIAIWA